MSILQLSGTLALTGIVARATLLLGIGWCGALALRRAPAAARHLVWLVVIAGAILIPAVARLTPVRVAMLPSTDLVPLIRSPQTRAVAEVADSAAVTPANPGRDLGSAATWGDVPFSVTNYATLAVGLWLVIAATLIVKIIIGTRSVARVVSGARAVDSAQWTRAVADMSNRLGLAAPPRLVVSDRVDMAFVCDALSPSIVLPASAEAWSDDRRRAVLLHEIAHIRRRDLVGHTIARVACAVYWFHPLVWVAARRLRAESELACDDLVLDSGVRPSDYAQHLLDLAMGLSHRQVAPAGALPMVRPREFEGRLLAILDRASRPNAVGRGPVSALVGVLGLLTMSIAAVVPVPRARETVSPIATPMASGTPVAAQPVPVGTPHVAPSARPRLSEATVASLLRYGTAGIINPMLMILRDADSLHLTARQADSIATLNRWYTVRLSAIWSPVAKYYAAHPDQSDQSSVNDRYSRAPQATMDLLATLAPDIRTLLTTEQRGRLSDRITAYLDVRNLEAIGTGRSGGPGGVFAPDDQFRGGQRGRRGGGM